MAELTFLDTVRHIQKASDPRKFEVTFRRKAAFYWLNESKTDALAALQTSAVTKGQVEVVADGLTSEIVSAKLASRPPLPP